MIVVATAPSPSPSPATAPSPSTTSLLPCSVSSPPPSKPPIDFSPPLIAMVVIIATAFVIVTYSRLISRHFSTLLRRYRRFRRRRRLQSYTSGDDLGSSPTNFNAPSLTTDASFHVLSPYGLDDAVIKTIPLSVYTRKSSSAHECAVCLLEFEENDYVRTLPVCYHPFHVDCIDIWLGTHANCPLCRAGIFRPQSPFIPVMASRIRPSLDDHLIIIEVDGIILEEEPSAESQNPRGSDFRQTVGEITQEEVMVSPSRNTGPITGTQSEDRFNGRDFMLKRSYSFGFERNLGSERLVMEPATASPWRYRRGGTGGSSFWGKRPSPFSSLTKHRVFSFRNNYRGMKSPFFRRRGGFFPFSESSARYSGGGGGGSSRRSKSMASPMFMRSSGMTAGQFSSSRLRSGDPEALLSPERFIRR